jgi:release factor glutamine methyltransferase
MSGSAQPPPQTWTIEAILRWSADDFRARGLDKPRLEAEVLLGHALGVDRMKLVIDSKRPLEPAELARFRDYVKRRRAREPVAYIVGQREFYGRPFRVDKRVLIPRPDTETLVDVALARTTACSLSMRALDLCTGSGCVAISLSRARPTACVHASDLSADALAVARESAFRLGAHTVSFWRGDLFGALPASCGPIDVIVANPPYIATAEVEGLERDIKDFEPRMALDGGADGLAFVRRIVEGATSRLARGATLATEIGAGEAAEVVKIFQASGFANVTVTRDLGRMERVVDGLWV